MSNTIASNNPPNHTCTEMNQQTIPPTSSLTSLPQTQQHYIETCFPTARRYAATSMNCLFSLIELHYSYQFLLVKGTTMQQKLKVPSVDFNFNCKIFVLFV